MNILLTSAGRRSYIVSYFKSALKSNGKVFASNNKYTIALQQSDGYFISPAIYDPNYIDSLIDFCKKKDISVVLSLFDIDLLVLSKAEERFKQNGIN